MGHAFVRRNMDCKTSVLEALNESVLRAEAKKEALASIGKCLLLRTFVLIVFYTIKPSKQNNISASRESSVLLKQLWITFYDLF